MSRAADRCVRDYLPEHGRRLAGLHDAAACELRGVEGPRVGRALMWRRDTFSVWQGR